MGNPHNDQHIDLPVTLDHDQRGGDDNNALVINGGNHHVVLEKLQDPTRVHSITWTLVGNARDGQFCSLDDPADRDNPGFTWLARKPGGDVFRNLLRLEKKNQLTIMIRHFRPDTEGVWYYQLFARFGNRIFGVPLTFAAGAASNPNPSIRNR